MFAPAGRAQGAVDIRSLRMVAAIAECGSMTLAARALNRTQPALSHQLRDLESRLRTPMFVRTARRLVLTPAGEQLVAIALSVLDQVDGYEREVHDGRFSTQRGTIRIATECYTAYHWLPSVLKSFSARWPKVDIRISAECTDDPLSALRQGALDMAIVYNQVNDKRVRLESLFDDELVLVTSPEHRFASRDFVTLESLRDEHLFTYTSSDGSAGGVERLLAAAKVTPKRTTRVQLTEALIELVAANLGVAILARWAVQPALRNRTIVEAKLTRRGHHRTWYAAVRSGDVTPAYQFDLIDLLRKHMVGERASIGAPHLRLASPSAAAPARALRG